MPIPATNRVRIIGGAFRRRVIRFPSVPGVRPTPDRVRETLFNWLGQDLAGRRCLDLYAGSGALTLEAASRGAALAVAVDSDRALVEALRATSTMLGAMAVEANVGEARAFVANERREFDVIFLDPPFASAPWDWLLPAAAARLAPGGLVYAESGAPLAPAGGLSIVRRDKAGHVHYHLLARAD